MRSILCVFACAAALCPALAAPRPAALSAEEQRAWARHVIPLPKEMALTGRVAVKRAEVKVVPSTSREALARRAAEELAGLIRPAATKPGRAAFTLALQLGGSEAEPLRKLKNSDQTRPRRCASWRVGW